MLRSFTMSALRRSTRLKAAATVQIGPVAVNDFSVDSEDVDADQTTDQPSPKKKRKPREPKPDPVYVIPDVEKKTTSFHGRLGYACLNTILRTQKPPVFCSRTCRIDTIKKNGMDFVKDIGRQNCEDLLELIKWNEQKQNIRFMRVSSEMFPFASHATYGYSLSFCAPLLARVGDLAKEYVHATWQPASEVITSSIRELQYHAELLDLMDLDQDAVMIIHGGGVYDDKEGTIVRMKENITNLPKNVRERLVLENDELCYNAEDLLPICEQLDVPLVFDYHHDALNPNQPKQHLSEQRPGAESIMERRAHADRCENLPQDLPDDMDLMIEAKDKEQAVLHLYRMYGLETVEFKSLRPPNENQTKETNGRKSNKRKKAKEADPENLSPTRPRKKRTKAMDEDSEGELNEDDMVGEVEVEAQMEPIPVKNSRRRKSVA
ncbi:UV-endonuclease UvdE-domain-containing protein [Mucidula mucida]|nr:UV-endonuclease UvdE-domain-containing protein [Mucidula mucida]